VPGPSPAAAPTTPPLDAEVALLQEAHAALRANDGDRALRAVADHGRRFPSGQLGEEFEAARVFALCELGRADEAHDVASRFLREHPRSPLAPRVANACESNAPSTF
jgi:outer membrane protein assembly factor BamD (BamD/ComL family)